MKICILDSFEDLLLKDTGYSIRIYNLAKSLAKLGNEVHVIIPQGKNDCQNVDGVVVHCIRGCSPKAMLKVLAGFIGAAKHTSLFFYDLVFVARASRVIRHSDVIQLEQQSAGALLIPLVTKIWKRPLIVDCHDVYQTSRVRHTGIIRRIVETFLEKMAYKSADAVLTVSEKEKQLLLSYGNRKCNVHVIPNGADVVVDSQLIMSRGQRKPSLENPRTVIFVGNMEYLPNREAVDVIASEIAPYVQKEVINTRFLIVGRMPERIYLPGLTFTGAVNSVADILAISDLAIAPLFRGSGTRLKILEYFSSGLPVVSTSVGVEGLDVENGIHALVEDDMREFAVKTVELLRDKVTSEKLGKAARELIRNKYSWEKIANKLNKLYVTTISEYKTKQKRAS